MHSKIAILFLLFLIAASNGSAQQKGGRIYKPSDYHTCRVADRDDSGAPLHTSLVLADDGWFSYKNYSDCSCWVWQQVTGTWVVVNDTLVLSWHDRLFPDSIIRRTGYILSGNKLYYSVPGESNMFANWGEFTLLQTKQDLFSLSPLENMLRELAVGKAYRRYLDAQTNYLTITDRVIALNILSSRSRFSEENAMKRNKSAFLSEEEMRYILSFYKENY